MDICNAGHEYPAICRNGEGYSIQKMPHGSPVAFLPGIPHTADHITLAPGERILLYTDGVTDAKQSAEERFGKERLTEVLNANKDKNDERYGKTAFKEICGNKWNVIDRLSAYRCLQHPKIVVNLKEESTP